ncbi:folate-sensitive fragile site protein Fra10Ac1-domain-containing protein [Lanmaoa asiatica]|nr:folate-sensitive fragile site protein Fra10Ac1-domain-containing protein [Lanmaoa asiatica]
MARTILFWQCQCPTWEPHVHPGSARNVNMSLFKPRTTAKPEQPAVTEFDILKASHRFLRDDTAAEGSASWNDQLAKKYYDSLYREFAICDLKHYKSGNFALRWRTESEVLDGIGETSCANTRCEHHRSPSSSELSTLELPFAYEEHGDQKEALVKIVLCPRCVRKLMWKRRHDKRDGKEKSFEQGHVIEKGGGTSDELRVSSPNDSLVGERRRPSSRSRSPPRRGEHRSGQSSRSNSLR